MATLGKTDKGGNYSNATAGRMYAYKVTLAEAADFSKATMYLVTASGDYKGHIVLYDHDAANNRPGNVVHDGGENTVSHPTDAWTDLTFVKAGVAAGTYWIAHEWDSNIGRYYDSAGSMAYLDGVYYHLPDPFGVPTGTVAAEYSLYLTYTAVGGVSVPVVMHHYGHHISKIIRG